MKTHAKSKSSKADSAKVNLLTNHWAITGAGLLVCIAIWSQLAGGQSSPTASAPSTIPQTSAVAPHASSAATQSSSSSTESNSTSGYRSRRRSDDSSPLVVDTPPRAIAAPPPIPASFTSLLRRSIFVKGQQVMDDQPRFREPDRSYTPTPAGSPEYVLVGVIGDGPSFIAFVENRGSGDVARVQTGDTLGNGGKVTALSLDVLQYSRNGRTIKIYVGQTLEGVTAVDVPTPAAASSSSSSSSSTPAGNASASAGDSQDGGGPPDQGPAPGANSAQANSPQADAQNPSKSSSTTAPSGGDPRIDDIIARLKARRAAENAQ